MTEIEMLFESAIYYMNLIFISGRKYLNGNLARTILLKMKMLRTIDINSRKYEVYNFRNNRLLFLKDVTDLTTIESAEYNDRQLCCLFNN